MAADDDTVPWSQSSKRRSFVATMLGALISGPFAATRLTTRTSAATTLPRLVEEPPPPGTPAGFRAYRFVDPNSIISGKLTSITFQNGVVTYEIAPVTRGQRFSIRRQNKKNPQESHVLLIPGGRIAPDLLQ